MDRHSLLKRNLSDGDESDRYLANRDPRSPNLKKRVHERPEGSDHGAPHKKARYSKRINYGRFDLLKGENRYFRVTIDYYTPRPHFIILVKEEKKQSVSCVDLANLATRHKEKFLQAVCDLVTKYSLGKPILSIHRGSWVTTKNRLHFHVCTDADKYVEIFESIKDQVEPSSWPKPTRQWRLGTRLEDYEKNVRGYPFKTFKKEDIDSIKKMIQEDFADTSLKELKFQKYDIVLHETQARLGFASKDKHSLLGVLDTMEQFAEEQGLTSTYARQNSELGGQLCLYLGEDPDTPGFPEDKGTVYGYIQLSGPRFYKMCPVKDRDQWFENFQKSTEKNYT